MQTYHVATRDITFNKRIRYALLGTPLFLGVFAVGLRVASHKWPGAALVVIAGVLDFSFTLFRKGRGAEYDLEVDEGDGLRLVHDGDVKRRVRKDHVRYVREWGSAPVRCLVISEHGPAFTRWLWGGIRVPATLPQYESIRSLALSWLKDS